MQDTNLIRILLLGFTIVIALLGLIGVVAVQETNQQANLTERLYQHPLTVSNAILEANSHIIEMHSDMKDVVLSRGLESRQLAISKVNVAETEVYKRLDVVMESFLGDKSRIIAFRKRFTDWRAIRSEIIELSNAGRYAEAAAITKGKEAIHVVIMVAEMDGLINFAKDKAAEFLSKSKTLHSSSLKKIHLLLLLFVVSSAVAAVFTARKLLTLTKRLRNSESQKKLILANIQDLIWLKDAKGVYLACNEMFEKFFGAKEIEIVGKTDFDFVDTKLAEFFTNHDKNAMAAKRALINEEWVTFASNGQRVLLETIKTPIRDGDGAVMGVLGVGHNITMQRQAESDLQLAASVFMAADEGIIITEPDGTIIDVNDAFSKITGYDRDEVVGKNPRILNSGHQGEEFFKNMWQELLEKGAWRGEIWNRRKDGAAYPEILTISAVYDEDSQVKNFVGLFSDITSIRQHQDDLTRLAQYDALTNLPNRTLLSDRLQIAMSQAKRRETHLAVAFIDLDRFKAVNDSHGRDIGDELLIALATRMNSLMREGDTLARIGGDEFVVVLSDLNKPAGSSPILNRLLSSISQNFKINELDICVSASIGVTFYPQSIEIDADLLQRQADQAMYDAKLAGRNCCRFFDVENDMELSNKFLTISNVGRALANNELRLFYQPKVNMRTSEVIGMEALIRWEHPEHGLLEPDQFLPDIEDHPISIEIGAWVIKTAIEQIEVWQKEGLKIPISVNVGAQQLQQGDFVKRLKVTLLKHPNVNPKLLELEILETSSLHDLDQAAAIIKECNKLGIEFALDDFGSGYSSLIYLKKLPVSVLKIDQEFVRSMFENLDDELILKGIIGLAENFNLAALAEGVETPAHGTLLLKLGCEFGQGYAIAKPMPASNFSKWLKHWDANPIWGIPSLSS